jgi:hypothetical protein
MEDIKILVGKIEGLTAFGRLRFGRKENIKMVLKLIWQKSAERIHLA